jgi:hypothetical protein
MFRVPAYWPAVPAALAVSAALALTAAPEPGAATSPFDDRRAEDLDPDQAGVRRDLAARLQTTKLRIEYKTHLIDRLVAGDATLAEVTDEFLRLNRGTPAMGVIRLYCPGSGDEERTARNVVGFVECRELPADRRAEVMARLGREFAGRFGRPLAGPH